MKRLAATIIVLAFLSPAIMAAEVTVTIPNVVIPFAVEICELYGESKHKPISMTQKECLELLIRDAIFVQYSKLKDREERSTAAEASRALRDQLNNGWPTPIADAFCGDGLLDIRYGEQCDDGNNTNGDGCNEQCQTE